MRRRSTRGPLSPEHRAKLAARATMQHALARGFSIPPEKRESYKALRRHGIRDDRIWPMLGLPMPERSRSKAQEASWEQ